MAVRKSINIAGSGPTIEAAVHVAIDRAYTTLEGSRRFEVTKISGDLTDAGPVFDVEVTIWFTLLERITSEPIRWHRAQTAGQVQPDGIGLATMPIGINHIESVNVYIVEDGELGDAGGLRHVASRRADAGLSTLHHALNARG